MKHIPGLSTFRLDSTLCLKICDYGLSRELYEKYYYDADDTKIPYKWLAPECLSEGRYTSKSDVVGTVQVSHLSKVFIKIILCIIYILNCIVLHSFPLFSVLGL